MKSFRHGVQRLFGWVSIPKAAAQQQALATTSAPPQRHYEACVVGDSARRAQVSVLALGLQLGLGRLSWGAAPVAAPPSHSPPAPASQGGCAICAGTLLYLREKGLDVKTTQFVDSSLDDAPAVVGPKPTTRG